MSEDQIFAEVYAIPHKEFYDILDDEDRDSLRRYGVSIDVSQQRFDQPMFYGKWKGLSNAKRTFQKKYFSLKVEKGKNTRARHCSTDTTEETTISMSEANEDTASIIPPMGHMERTHTQIQVETTDNLQSEEPAVLNKGFTGYGDIIHSNTLVNEAKNTCLLGQHTQNTAVGSTTDIITKTNREKSDIHPDPIASHTTLKAGCTMMACKGLKTCEGQHFSNSNESHQVLNTVESANCKETERLRNIADEYGNAENDTNTEKLLYSADASRSVLCETNNNVQEKSNTLNDNGLDKDQKPDEHYGFFHKFEDEDNGLDNKRHYIDRQEKEEKEIRRGKTPSAQRDAVPSTVGSENGMSFALDQSQNNANSTLFTAENIEAPQGIPQQDITLNILRPAVNDASRHRSQSSAASIELGKLVDNEWEEANDQGAHEGPRDNEREKDAERPNHEGDHNAQIGLQMEKNDGGHHRHNPTPTVNNLIEIDSVDHEPSQALDCSQQMDYSRQGARPKATQSQNPTLQTCSEEGTLKFEKCVDHITQTSDSFPSKLDNIEISTPSSYTRGIGNNSTMPDYTHVCNDLKKDTAIIGVNKKDAQPVYDGLTLEGNGSKENQTPENNNGMFNQGNTDHINDDENTGENPLSTGEMEKTVEMDYPLFRYMKKFHKTDLANIKEEYKVKVKAETLPNGQGVRLQGLKMNMCGTYKKIHMLLTELDDILRKDSIDVSAFSYSDLEIKRKIEGLKQTYKWVLFEYKENTILLIGDQEHISQAKQELLGNLSGIHPNNIARPTGNLVHAHRRSSPKGPRGIKQPLIAPSSPIGYTYSTKRGKKIHILQGDITKLFVGAVVSASSTNLEHGGGVAGAISKAAGPQLQAKCARYVRQSGALKTSEAITTDAYNMTCQCIIHVAGSRWADCRDKKKAEGYLAASFRNVLAEADRLNLQSIAIPAIGSGSYGAPLAIVAQTMFDAVSTFIRGTAAGREIRDILLVDINTEILELLRLHFEQAVFQGRIQSTAADFDRFICRSGLANTSEAEEVGNGYIKKVGDSQFYQATPNKTLMRKSPRDPSNRLKRKSFTGQESGDSVKSTVAKGIKPPQTNPGPNQQLSHMSSHMKSTNQQKPPDKDDTCAICMETPTNKVVLSLCKHVFCKNCIDTWFKNKPTCPNCGQLHGEMKGDQPRGTMTTDRLNTHLPGYSKCRGTIVINYNFPSGKQQDCHPNPGRWYQSTRRTAYLPDNREGSHVLGLLERAFDAKLTFTIGRSTTTGLDDQITWNDIHHKTNMSGGPAGFGYPDENYLKRVKEELAAKGIK